MTKACHDKAYTASSENENKHTFTIQWKDEVGEFESPVVIGGWEKRNSEIIKLRNQISSSIGWLIAELKSISARFNPSKTSHNFEWWENIVRNHHHVVLKINSLVYCCNYPENSRQNINRLLDKLGNYLCLAGFFIQNFKSDDNKNRESVTDLVYEKIIPLLKNLTDLLTRDYVLW